MFYPPFLFHYKFNKKSNKGLAFYLFRVNIRTSIGNAVIIEKEQRKMEKAIRNISGSIWEKEIPAIVAEFKAEGISEFTITNEASGLIGKLAAFEANGAKVQGLTQVESSSVDIETGKPEMISAILMRLI